MKKAVIILAFLLFATAIPAFASSTDFIYMNVGFGGAFSTGLGSYNNPFFIFEYTFGYGYGNDRQGYIHWDFMMSLGMSTPNDYSYGSTVMVLGFGGMVVMTGPGIMYILYGAGAQFITMDVTGIFPFARAGLGFTAYGIGLEAYCDVGYILSFSGSGSGFVIKPTAAIVFYL